ncbi:25S rRNA (cytosine-C(5))-methyltransferase NSUN5-like protein [Drosera capensis]
MGPPREVKKSTATTTKVQNRLSNENRSAYFARREAAKGKGSSMVAAALGPQPGWQVLDACSAPGNKTIHIAALMKGNGKGIACELHPQIAKILANTVRMAGADSPSVERIVYSMCSIHQIENEDVIKSVMPIASSCGFHLATPFPLWPRRGLPVVDGCMINSSSLSSKLTGPQLNETVVKSTATTDWKEIIVTRHLLERQNFSTRSRTLASNGSQRGRRRFLIALFVKNNAKASAPEIPTNKRRKVHKHRTHIYMGCPFFLLRFPGCGFIIVQRERVEGLSTDITHTDEMRSLRANRPH